MSIVFTIMTMNVSNDKYKDDLFIVSELCYIFYWIYYGIIRQESSVQPYQIYKSLK